jgi:formylglycine-generating enzyme required for sulfatase activity
MIDHWIATLKTDLGLSADEIANFIWLATLRLQSLSQSGGAIVDDQVDNQTGVEEDSKGAGHNLNRGSNQGNPQVTSEQQQEPEQKFKREGRPKVEGGLFPNQSTKNLQSVGSKTGSHLVKVKNPPSIRNGLELARSLRPLIRVVPSSRSVKLDETETVRKIAESRILLPVTKPVLEPWLDLALVVDESSSMLVWRQTVLDLQRLLKQYGAFRDVRTWGLVATEEENSQDFQQYKVYLRSGFGTTATRQDLQDPKALVDPNRRRVVLVVTDCLSAIWRRGSVFPALNTWAENGPMAIVQMLPEWLWVRTALRHTTPVQFYGLEQGIANQQLFVVGSSTFEQEEEGIAKTIRVPVLTLEPHRMGLWSQMVAGKGGVLASGVIFSPYLQSFVDQNELRRRPIQQTATDLSPQKRVDDFRLTATPVARRLASLVAAAPVINLPVVRLIQETLLGESQQVHVAEVLLGGLLTPTEQANLSTNPDDVVYRFVDEDIRPILLITASVMDTTEVFSKYVQMQFGTSLEVFLWQLKVWMSSEDKAKVDEVRPLAIVTAEVLKRWGRHYADIVQEVEKRYELVISEKIQPQHQTLFPGDRDNILKRKVVEVHRPKQLLNNQEADALIAEIVSEANRLTCIYTGFSAELHLSDQLSLMRSAVREGFVVDGIGPQLQTERPFRSDLHNLFPARAEVNRSRKNHLPFRNLSIQEVEQWFYEDRVLTSRPTDEYGLYSRVAETGFEPRDVAKGPISRALFYLFVIHEQYFDSRYVAQYKYVLREWHRVFPATQVEFRRSVLIAESAQGNINPFVLDPTLIDRIFFAEPETEWQTFEFSIATVVLLLPIEVEVAQYESDEPSLVPFEFQIATLNTNFFRIQPYTIQRTTASAFQLVEDLGNKIVIEMVSIPSGHFAMGAPIKETASDNSEQPQHNVEIRQSFFIGKYPVTQSQWRVVAAMTHVSRNLQSDPSRFKGDDRPVESISWLDAVEFCKRLSIYTGRDYRLPTEAEWEYACRAGTTTPFHFGKTITPELANYNWSQPYIRSDEVNLKESSQGTTPVGSFSVANAFGLSDMHGNVWEWCEDHWHGNYDDKTPKDGRAWLDNADQTDKTAVRVLRGGSWSLNPGNCRSASRFYNDARDEFNFIGFRVVCSASRTL